MPGYGKFKTRAKRTYGAKRRVASTAASKIQRAARAKLARSKPVRGTTQRAKINTISITKLARQINSLKRADNGPRQTMMQRVHVPADQWLHNTPLCFTVNNFRTGTHMMKGFWHPAPPPDTGGEPKLAYLDAWHKADLHQDFYSELPDTYNYWAGAQDDNVSRQSYLPISSRMEFDFRANMAVGQEPIWIRVDLIQPKKILRNSTAKSLGLPTNLFALKDMALNETSMDTIRNKYNPTYFTVKSTKWVKLHAPATNAQYTVTAASANPLYQDTHGAQHVERTKRMHINWYGKGEKVQLGLPEEGTTEDAMQTTSSQNFFSNVEEDKCYYMIFNSSGPGVEIFGRRTLAWRDKVGVST